MWCLLWVLPGHATQVVVNVEGDYPALEDNAEVFIGDVEGRSADNLRRYVSTAKKQVQEALKALGYYSPLIEWEVVEGEGEDGLAQLTLTVIPGEPVRIASREVVIEGPAAEDDSFQAAIPKSPSKGDVLNHGEYTTLRQSIQNRARVMGYFDGEFVSRTLTVDPEKRTAAISIRFRSGERYRLGDVDFPAGHGFETSLLDKFVTFDPGQPYHADEIARLSRDLSNSGYFSGVDIDASPGSAR
ncbi:MAG: POTRA domain-containing protein, partial [Marinobacter sp.]|nr:POTRA domain-containing protein [Marinobacter sp.]